MLEKEKELPLVSIVLVAVNIIVFLICTFTGDLLYNRGGVELYGVLALKEYGRLLWAMFIHVDINHLFNNMLILFFVGGMIEKETGHLSYAVVYFLSGIGGNLLSLAVKYVNRTTIASVGASGAVFGLDGLLLAMVLLSGSFRKTATPGRVFLVIVMSLYSGFMRDNVDNAAHVGGLIVGFAAGSILCLVRKRRQKII